MVALPFEKVVRTGEFTVHDFQEVDLQQLTESSYSANWSEMGCFKTTTAENWILRRLEGIRNPRVLIITTKSGKGAYYQTLEEVLDPISEDNERNWEIYTVGTQQFNRVLNGNVVPFDVELPRPEDPVSVVVIAHYNCFMNRACRPTPIREPKTVIDPATGAKVPGPVKRHPLTNEIMMHVPRLNEVYEAHWDAIILDEAHRIKNPDAQWSQNIKRLRNRSANRHIMTGTGFINDPSEIHNLLDFLGGRDLVPARNKFRDTYCKQENQGGYWRVVGIIPHMKDEFINLTRQVGVRRTLKETHPNIAEPIFTKIPVELNDVQRKMYNEIMDMLHTYDPEGNSLHITNVLTLLGRARQVAVATPYVTGDYYDEALERRVQTIELREPSSKLDALMEVIEGLEWDNDPEGTRQQLVVFSNFRDPIDLAIKRFENAKPRPISYLHMDTSDSERTRYEKWKEIWPKKEHQVFICTLQLGGESINLALGSAERAVFLDRSWSPKDNLQAVGRLYRPGQKGVTQIINIEAIGTVDQYVESKVNRKVGWFREIFHPED